jgi:hypothetical protein
MTLYPRSAANQGVHPNSFSFRCLHRWTCSESIKELGGASTLVKIGFANKMIMFEKALEFKQAIILSYWWHLTMICRKSS